MNDMWEQHPAGALSLDLTQAQAKDTRHHSPGGRAISSVPASPFSTLDAVTSNAVQAAVAGGSTSLSNGAASSSNGVAEERDGLTAKRASEGRVAAAAEAARLAERKRAEEVPYLGPTVVPHHESSVRCVAHKFVPGSHRAHAYLGMESGDLVSVIEQEQRSGSSRAAEVFEPSETLSDGREGTSETAASPHTLLGTRLHFTVETANGQRRLTPLLGRDGIPRLTQGGDHGAARVSRDAHLGGPRRPHRFVGPEARRACRAPLHAQVHLADQRHRGAEPLGHPFERTLKVCVPLIVDARIVLA